MATKTKTTETTRMHRALIRTARAEAKRRGVGKLLTGEQANTKFAKTDGTPVMVVGLSLAQHKLAGANMCAHASPGCVAVCVGSQGLARVWGSITDRRVRKTRFLIEEPVLFRALLWHEIDLANARARKEDRKLGVRLNTFSDLPWIVTDRHEIDARLDVVFYDYTKVWSRYDRWLRVDRPANYYLTYSRSETTPLDRIRFVIAIGGTVAVPFRVRRKGALPTSWDGMPVIDGDASDYRPDDAPGSIVGLRAKGSSMRDQTGFVVDVRGLS